MVISSFEFDVWPIGVSSMEGEADQPRVNQAALLKKVHILNVPL